MQRFASEIDVHEPVLALTRLAQRMQHPQADLIVGVLVATEGQTVGDTAGTLQRLAVHIRSEIATMEDMMAKRAGIRMERNVTALLGISLMAGVVLFAGLGEFYEDAFGQSVLVGVGIVFALGMFWMSKLEKFKTPARFRLRGTRTI